MADDFERDARDALARLCELHGNRTAADLLREERRGAVIIGYESSPEREWLEEHFPELFKRRCILYVASPGEPLGAPSDQAEPEKGAT